MSRPNLPKHFSSENMVFHPVFMEAARQALINQDLQDSVTIHKEYLTPTGPVDFVFFDENTQKVILPIEIKRSQSSVRGQGRRQARDYWGNLGANCQTPFYCVSNLEITELFRFSSARPRTSAQRVHLDNAKAGELETTVKDDFYKGLIQCIEELLQIVFNKKPFVYAVGLTQLQASIESARKDYDRWHQIFIPACFEYIRGSAHRNSNLKAKTKSWRSAAFYRATPARLARMGERIDFAKIFREPMPIANDPNAFLEAVLIEAYESGKALAGGDDIAELVNEILAPTELGIVETDVELAQLMAVFAKSVVGRELREKEKVMDPGSGSGRLLTALTSVAFQSLQPKQLWANEKEVRFAESLSLRLGLAFSQIIDPTNAPKITLSGIEKIERYEFSDVKLIVMNPPFISGVQSAEIKRDFSARIAEISSSASLTIGGQIALEALFLELVWHLAADGTVITTVFPAQHLYRSSKEVVRLRQFLIREFGLTHIIRYPGRGLFENVVKQTVILIGKKTSENISDTVQLVEVQKPVGDVDFAELHINILKGDFESTHGVVVTPVERQVLMEASNSGWKNCIATSEGVYAYINQYFNNYRLLGELPISMMRRGTIGNSGNTRLTVISVSEPRYKVVVEKIPTDWFKPLLNNATNMPRILTATNSPQMSFLPSESAYRIGTAENQVLVDIVTNYVDVHQQEQGKQARKKHTIGAIIHKLKADQRDFKAGWVLVPRASRAKGEISLLEEDGILLSTNFGMIKLPTARERMLLASWLLSIFGQLQLEFYGTPQEGMRKLEMRDIKKIAYPNLLSIPDSIANQLCSSFASDSAIEFTNISSRPSDLLWAKVVDPANFEKCLASAIDLFQGEVDERIGYS